MGMTLQFDYRQMCGLPHTQHAQILQQMSLRCKCYIALKDNFTNGSNQIQL